MSRPLTLCLICLAAAVSCTPTGRAQPTPGGTQPTTRAARSGGIVEFPGVVVDRAARQVRVECQALGIDAPLEFFCVSRGGPEHESVLRTAAKASHIHAGLLMLGLEPGSPMRFSEAKQAWSPPYGPPVAISCEWIDAAGKRIRKPATALMRPLEGRTPTEAQQPRWVFAGSTQRQDGAYLADIVGYIVGVVNFEHTVIDVPELVSSSNDTLAWTFNAEAGPKQGDAVTMIIEPLAGATSRAVPTVQPATDDVTGEAWRNAFRGATTRPSAAGEQADREAIPALRERWRATVKPHERALAEAARAHHAVVAELRRRQQSLVDEADRLQALIDELEREYQQITTPKPQ